MTFRKNNSGNIDMVNTGVMLVVLLVVLYIGVNIIDNVEEATAVDIGSAATETLTFTDLANDSAMVTVSTVTFELDTEGNTTAGNVVVPIGDTAILTAVTNLTAYINANATVSALVTAANTSTTVGITADARGTSANSIVTTTNAANATWGAATMSGGVEDDTFYTTNTDLIGTTEASFAMAGIMPIVMIAVAVLGGLLGVLYLFRRRD